MKAFAEKAGGWWAAVRPMFRIRRERAPLTGVQAVADFVATRSAYIAQRTLLSYVKTRMGIRYPKMFDDPKVIESLDIAKLHIVIACMSDLAIFAAANVATGGEAAALARHLYERGLEANAASSDRARDLDDFDRRLALTDWDGRARDADNFTESPRALLRWAPIAEELKSGDAEILQNSIRYAWRDVREQFRARIDAPKVAADWRVQAGGAR